MRVDDDDNWEGFTAYQEELSRALNKGKVKIKDGKKMFFVRHIWFSCDGSIEIVKGEKIDV